MNRTTILGFILLMGITSCSTSKRTSVNQGKQPQIWVEQTRVREAINFEKSLLKECEILNQNVSLSKSVFPLFDDFKIGNPFIVKRKQTGFLPIYAEYFFSKPDSILRYVSYDWERDRFGNLFTKPEIWKEESKKLKDYNKEYEKIKTGLIKKFGEPTEQDYEPKMTKSISGGGDYLSRDAIWDTEKIHVKLNMIFESMTYRIRLNYYWKN